MKHRVYPSTENWERTETVSQSLALLTATRNGKSNQIATHDAAAQDKTDPFLLYRMITVRHESRHGPVGTRDSIEEGAVRLSASLLTQCPLL